MGLIKDLKLVKNIRIIRRYFIINGFDGAITVLGLLLGFFYVGTTNIRTILAAGLGTAVAMCISGISSAYLSEKAEKIKELREIEKAMLKTLRNTKIGNAAKTAPLITGLVNGTSPLLMALVILVPFIIGNFIPANVKLLFYLSFILCFLSLFLMGMFMGKISKTNMVVYGLKTLLVGIATVVILMLLKLY